MPPKGEAAEGKAPKGFTSAFEKSGIGFPIDKGGAAFELGACLVSVGKGAKRVGAGWGAGLVNCLAAGSSALVLPPSGELLSRTSLKSACGFHERIGV